MKAEHLPQIVKPHPLLHPILQGLYCKSTNLHFLIKFFLQFSAVYAILLWCFEQADPSPLPGGTSLLLQSSLERIGIKMSASRERKKRQEFIANGGVDRKAAQEAERKAAERKSAILYTTIAVLFLAITVALLIYNSGILQRKSKAVTVDGTTYTADDLAFYYYEAQLSLYNNAVSQFGQYGPSMIGLNPNVSYKEQKAFNATDEDAQTWDEYFKEQAVTNLRFVTAAAKAAKAENYTLTDEDNTYIEERIQQMKTAAAGTGSSYSKYIPYVYGSLVTKDCFESNLRDYALATSYASHHSDSLTYTEDQVKAVYDGDKDAYDNVAYRLVSVNGNPESKTDADGNAVEATDEEKAEAWAAAQETAQALYDAYNAGADLEAEAEKYENATYTQVEKGSSGTSSYIEWCFESGRKAGDVKLIEEEDSSRCYVVVFDRRYLDETKTVDVRHVLINADSFPDQDSESVTDEQMKAKADEVMASWDGTEEGFAQLAREYSQDSNASSGGIYTEVYDGRMVETFNDWCFDPSRAPGDSGIVKTDYGYHLMYYVADNLPQWYLDAEDSLRTKDYNDWYDALLEDIGEAEINDEGMDLVGK